MTLNIPQGQVTHLVAEGHTHYLCLKLKLCYLHLQQMKRYIVMLDVGVTDLTLIRCSTFQLKPALIVLFVYKYLTTFHY